MPGSQPIVQDSTQVLQRIFTGHLVGQPAMGYEPLGAIVVAAQGPVTDREVIVTITGFPPATTQQGLPTPTFVCKYQCPQGVTPPTPGTPCLVVFPGNEPFQRGWAVDFLGWPKIGGTGGAIVGTGGGPPT